MIPQLGRIHAIATTVLDHSKTQDRCPEEIATQRITLRNANMIQVSPKYYKLND